METWLCVRISLCVSMWIQISARFFLLLPLQLPLHPDVFLVSSPSGYRSIFIQPGMTLPLPRTSDSTIFSPTLRPLKDAPLLSLHVHIYKLYMWVCECKMLTSLVQWVWDLFFSFHAASASILIRRPLRLHIFRVPVKHKPKTSSPRSLKHMELHLSPHMNTTTVWLYIHHTDRRAVNLRFPIFEKNFNSTLGVFLLFFLSSARL